MVAARMSLLAGFLLLVVGGGFAIGLLSGPGPWYRALAKPSFTPPNWVFPVAWSILYVLVAAAGWRTFERGRESLAMKLWWVQLALNFSWPVAFFTGHMIGPALAIIVLLLLAIIAFIATTFRSDLVSALLFVPYAVWVAFASLLNGSLLAMN